MMAFHAAREMIETEVRVPLRRGERRVSEQLLQDAQIGAAREHVGCETMPQSVRVERLQQSCRGSCVAHDLVSAPRVHGLVAEKVFSVGIEGREGFPKGVGEYGQ